MPRHTPGQGSKVSVPQPKLCSYEGVALILPRSACPCLRHKDFVRRSGDRTGNRLAFLPRDDERRCQQEVVPALAVNATLRRIREHTVLHSRLVQPSRRVPFARERLSRSLVSYKFNAGEQAQAAHLADMGMRSHGFERGKELTTGLPYSRKETLPFEHIQNSVTGGGGDRVRLVCESMLKCAGTLGKGLDHARPDDHRSQGRVT